MLSKTLWLCRKLQVWFWLRSYSGGFSWLKFTTERRFLCVPWRSARNLLHLSPWHLKVPSPGRGTYLPHIPRPYKHNVFKFWLCLFVWLFFFFLKGMIEPFTMITCSWCWFPIFQSSPWLFPWRWISSLYQEKLVSFEGQRESLYNHCKQCNAGREALMCDSTWKCSRHVWWPLLFQKHHSVSEERNVLPFSGIPVFKDHKILAKVLGGNCTSSRHPNVDIGHF